MSDDTYEDECAECYHGASFHTRRVGDEFKGYGLACEAPDCECQDFVQPEYDDE